jgi:hypothetical protein
MTKSERVEYVVVGLVLSGACGLILGGALSIAFHSFWLGMTVAAASATYFGVLYFSESR